MYSRRQLVEAVVGEYFEIGDMSVCRYVGVKCSHAYVETLVRAPLMSYGCAHRSLFLASWLVLG